MTTEFVEDNTKNEVITALSKKDSEDSILNAELDEYISKFLDMSNEAKDSDHKEKTMTLKEGLKSFPKAIGWSVLLSTALIMEGYDTNLLSNLYALSAFKRKFGFNYGTEEAPRYEVPAKWQTSLGVSYQCGQLIGLFIAGFTADIVGYRKTLMFALATSIGLIFIQFFAPNIEVLLVSYVLLGINWGSYQTITVTYAAEVAPATLRVYLTTYVNMCWVFGQLISSGVLKGVSGLEGANSYRIPFAIQWIWPIPLFIGVYLAPESPWFLVKRGRNKEAKQSIKRLLSENPHLPDRDLVAGAMLTKIQLALKEESLHTTGNIADCFKGADFRRTRIAALTWLFQSITGSSLQGFSTYFYIQAGLSESHSFTMSIVQYVLGIIGTLSSWVATQKFGRRDLYLAGLFTQALLLIIVGGLGCATQSSGIGWAIGSMLLIFTFVYDASVGPICYCIVAEIPSARLRAKTVMLARNLYNIANLIVGILMPYMLNPEAWNWKAKSAFLFCGFAIIGTTWVFFELPETKDRTFAELDVLFESGVSSRNFKSTEVEVFNANKMMQNFGQEGIKNFVREGDDHIDIDEKA